MIDLQKEFGKKTKLALHIERMGDTVIYSFPLITQVMFMIAIVNYQKNWQQNAFINVSYHGNGDQVEANHYNQSCPPYPGECTLSLFLGREHFQQRRQRQQK